MGVRGWGVCGEAARVERQSTDQGFNEHELVFQDLGDLRARANDGYIFITVIYIWFMMCAYVYYKIM